MNNIMHRRSSTPPPTRNRTTQKTILVVEDDADRAMLIRSTLAKAGHRVFLITKAIDALTVSAKHWIDLAIVNINMPSQDSIWMCQELRRVMHVPIIALTTIDVLSHQITFLIDEVDDHLSMPVLPNELLVRVELLFRNQRNKRRRRNIVATGDLILDKVANIVTVGRSVINLTPNECQILSYLMHKPGETVRKNEIIRAVWRSRFYNDSNALRVNIRRLRRKIERNPSKPGYLLTVYGVGYTLHTAGQFAI